MSTRRAWIATLLATAVASTTSGAAFAEPAAVRGVVLITIESLRPDHVGAYGGPIETPQLDALAAGGTTLEHAVTPTPSTGPAHASLLTGLHPWRHAVLDNAVPLPERARSLAEIALQNGVSTAAFVSSYLLLPRFRFDRGFRTFESALDQPRRFRGETIAGFSSRGAVATEAAMRWLNTQAASQAPFLLWVHYFDPHDPYDPPSAYAPNPDEVVSREGKSLPAGVRHSAGFERQLRAYRGEVRYVDRQIGRLLERLRLLGIADRTAVVLTSDHGEGLGDHGTLAHGVNLYDELIRVPLIVRAPGIEAGRRLSGPVQLEDLHPTLLGLLGLPVAPGIDGFDLLPWLRGEVDASPRPASIGQRKPLRAKPELFFQRRHPQKWVGSPHAAGRLFALDADPGEHDGSIASGVPEFLDSKLSSRRYGDSQQTPPVPRRRPTGYSR